MGSGNKTLGPKLFSLSGEIMGQLEQCRKHTSLQAGFESSASSLSVSCLWLKMRSASSFSPLLPWLPHHYKLPLSDRKPE